MSGDEVEYLLVSGMETLSLYGESSISGSVITYVHNGGKVVRMN